MSERSAEIAHTPLPIPDGTPVVCLGTMVGVPKGTPAVLRHASPSGHRRTPGAFRPPLYWAELDDYIYWSHGHSEAKGYWGTAAEFEVAS